MRALERFCRQVEFDISTGCWLWQGAVSGHGYGSFRARGRTWLPHRFALMEFERVYLPPDKYVCHRCDNPLCVRPAHLFVGTSSANARDRNAKRRHGGITHPERQVRGNEHPGSKLTESQVLWLRSEWRKQTRTQSQLASVVGVSQTVVSNVVTLKTWKHVKGETP